MPLRLVVGILLTSLLFQAASAQEFKNWPSGSSPQEIGKRVSDRFIQSPHGIYGAGTRAHIPYFEVCTWYGALTFAKETDDQELLKKLALRFEPLFSTEASLLPSPDHVDYNVFGAIALGLYFQTKDERYRKVGLHYADTQWDMPTDTAITDKAKEYLQKGHSWQTRLWIDDMYMITLIQAQAYRATGDKKYINRAAKEMVLYLDELQQSNGLFYHAPDAPFFWGRGNGWMAAGMTELLRALPADNPDRPRILQSYQKMMATLLGFQDKNGMWHQLVDEATSWPETSCTGMFTFAMVTGVKNGWLKKSEYENASRKAWLVLISYINEKGDLREICEGTGKKNDHQYYLDRKRNVGDFHGQGPVLWSATALLRK